MNNSVVAKGTQKVQAAGSYDNVPLSLYIYIHRERSVNRALRDQCSLHVINAVGKKQTKKTMKTKVDHRGFIGDFFLSPSPSPALLRAIFDIDQTGIIVHKP